MLNLYDALEPDIRPYVFGVPDFVMKPALSRALWDFCNESACWTDDQILSAYDNDILLYANDPLNCVVINVLWARRHGSRVDSPFVYQSGKLVLECVPQCDLDVRVVLGNNRASHALMLPDWMVDQHHGALVHLTCYYLMSQEGKPWANAQMAAFHYRQYRAYLGDAVIKATPGRVQLRPFA